MLWFVAYWSLSWLSRQKLSNMRKRLLQGPPKQLPNITRENLNLVVCWRPPACTLLAGLRKSAIDLPSQSGGDPKCHTFHCREHGRGGETLEA